MNDFIATPPDNSPLLQPSSPPLEEPAPALLRAWGNPYGSQKSFWIDIVFSSILQGITFGFVALAVFLGFTSLQEILWNVGDYKAAIDESGNSVEDNNKFIQETLVLGSGNWWYVGLLAVGGAAVGLVKIIWTLVFRSFPTKPSNFLIDVDNLSSDEPWESIPIAICAVLSIGSGASCGPEMPLGALSSSFGGVGLPNLLRRFSFAPTSGDQCRLYGLDAMAAAFGPLMPSQFLSPLLLNEIGQPLWKSRGYNFEFMEIIARMGVASTISFAVFTSLKNRTILHTIPAPEAAYDEISKLDGLFLLYGAILGIVCGVIGTIGFIMLGSFAKVGEKVCTSIDRLGVGIIKEKDEEGKISSKHEQHIPRTYLGMIATPTIGGVLVGLLAVACPLTLGDGSAQLNVILLGSPTLGIATLLVSAFIKLLAMSISLGFGFIGGNVFPYLFAGACVGSATNLLVPAVPILISYPSCMAAMCSSIFPLIFTFVSFVSMAMALGGAATGPVFISCVASYSIGPGSGFCQKLLSKTSKNHNKKVQKEPTNLQSSINESI